MFTEGSRAHLAQCTVLCLPRDGQNCDSNVVKVKLQKTKTQKLALKRRSQKTQTQLEVKVRQKTKTQKLKDAKVRIRLFSTPGQYILRSFEDMVSSHLQTDKSPITQITTVNGNDL